MSSRKYRKKPVVVEAFHWLHDEAPAWVIEAIKAWRISFNERGMLIHTLEGTMIASPGDYVIKGVDGELYPCKPDIFEKTYEEVQDA